MENTTATNNKGATNQQKVDHLNKYNRNCYHAHKNASNCENCKKTVVERERPAKAPSEESQM